MAICEERLEGIIAVIANTNAVTAKFCFLPLMWIVSVLSIAKPQSYKANSLKATRKARY
jgi:hypothetical protein